MPRNTPADRAARAAALSSAPDAQRTVSPDAEVGKIRSVAAQTTLPAARHHELRQRLGDLAFTSGVSPKWLGVEQALGELVALALTDETTWRKLEERLVELVRDR